MIGKRLSPWQYLLKFGLEYFGRYYSSYIGFVVNNNDPDNIGRIQVRVPSIDGQSIDPTWAYSKSIMGGEGYGINLIPNQGATVWVEYINGDSRYPVWSHYGWTKKQKPEEFTNSNIYGFKTPLGQLIMIDDEEEIITVKTKEGKYIEIKDNKVTIDGEEIHLGKDDLEPVLKGDKTVTQLNREKNRNDTYYKVVGSLTPAVDPATAITAVNAIISAAKIADNSPKPDYSDVKSNKTKTE